jgi:hypothetical protein
MERAIIAAGSGLHARRLRLRRYNPGTTFIEDNVRRFLALLLLFLLLASLGSTVAVSQRPDEPPFGQRRAPLSDEEAKMEREREKRFNKDRHAAIKKDTDKLLALATELKQYVDKTNENVMSVDVIKKAEEIEKLAHRVRDKMKDAGIAPPPMLEPPR